MSYSSWKKTQTGYDCEQSSLSQHHDGFVHRGRWLAQPAPRFDEALILGTGDASLYSNQDWTFPVMDEGAITFTVTQPMEQLRIDLNSGLTTAAGYTIVVGQPNVIYRRSFQQYTPLPARGVMNANLKHTADLWMSYEHGIIAVGHGTEFGNNVFLTATDGEAAPMMRQIWFGGWNNPDCVRTRITNVRFYRYNKPVHRDIYQTHCPA